MPDNYFEEEEFETQFNGKTLLRIAGQLKPYWKRVTIFLLSILVTSVIDSYFTFLSKRIIDEGIVAGNMAALWNIVKIYAAMVLGQAGLVFSFIYNVGMLGERVRYDLRQRMFNHLQDLSLSYYSRTPVGWIMSRVTSDSDRVADLVTWGVLDMTWSLVSILTSSYFMLMIDWRLGLIVMCIIPILIIIAIQFRKRILVEFRRTRKLNSKITGAFNENITGVRVVKALGREDGNMQEFSYLTSDMYRSAYRAAWLSALFLPSVQMISALALGSIVYYGGLQASYGALTIGGIQAFISYLAFMMWPIQDMARVYAEMQNSIASAERMYSLIDAVPDVANRPAAFDPGTISGDIIFDHVDFYYDDGLTEQAENKPVLHDFSLHVKRGETIALVGPTGGGKSTIVNLMCRFYEPKKGKISIGGYDYTGYTLQSIQSRIGMVLQTPHLFSGSIRENIRYGKLNATDAEVEEAARLAGAHEFILKFNKGYDEDVGEGGNMLSVGQKQLISLARAVLARPELFIMDEATSSVDTLTEALIQKGMETLMKGRTSFIIAHRLSTIKRASRILVIEGGRIVEMGTHAELLRNQGHYYRLYTRQFRHQREQEFDVFKEAEQIPAMD
ncbi:MAG: ABC transporter ATP-binding protein [Omnitrophica WOR_2 bacterium]